MVQPWSLVALLVLTGGISCERGISDPADPRHAASLSQAPMAPIRETGTTERARVLGSFLEAHWQLPIAPQGPAPAGWSPAEASLEPALCGACHPQQFAQWQGSLHAGAFSPGLAGQLIEGALAEPEARRACQACHTPLAEQQPALASGAPSPHYQPGLREQGLVCAGCHVRAHRHHGPPRRVGAEPAPEPVPHDGFVARPEFQESRFCSPCHQFFDRDGPNGKPVENTFAEWKASPHAAEGKTCQTCHMPDRAHLWRGIHDPEMVRSGVRTELHLLPAAPGQLRAALVLASVEVGHHFPTYVTPRVTLELWLEDAGGHEIEASRRQAVIAREIDFGSYTEVFDTRVPAGESVKLELDTAWPPGAAEVIGRITVDPDYFYRGMFEGLLPGLQDPDARAKITEAHRRASASIYVLTEHRRALDEVGAHAAESPKRE